MLKPHPIARACALTALLTGVFPALSVAQEGPPGSDAQPRPGARLERVEVSSRAQTDTDLRRKAPIAKQIYGREEMDKFGDTNVADVLKRLPGVTVAGGAPRMRGLGAGYTLILINGDPAPPGFALDQLDPAQVERIEVTKGPSADQSAQAVAGAINIILKDAPRVSQRDLRLGVGYTAVRPTPSATFTYGERLGGLSMSVPLSAFEWRNQNESITDRRLPGSDRRPSELIQNVVSDNWGHGFNSAPRLNWKISDEESLNFQGFVQKGFWHNRGTVVATPVSGRPVADDNSLSDGTFQMLRGNLQWVDRFSDSQRVELKGGVQDSKGTFKNETFRGGATQRSSLGDNHEQSLTQAGKYAQLIGESHSLTLGWDLEWRKRDETRSVSELDRLTGLYKPQLPSIDGAPFSAKLERQALFIQDEWEIAPQWSTSLGLRGERIVTQSRGSGDAVRNVSSVITPLWHLNYRLDPGPDNKGRDLIRGSITRSYKAPDMGTLLARPAISNLFPLFDPVTGLPQSNEELSPDRAGNPNLKPELATGLDLAYEKYLTGGGMISIGGFHRSVTNLMRTVTTLETVDYSPVPRYVARTINFSKAQTTGLELELKGRAGELIPAWFDTKLPLNLRSSLSLYHSQVEAVTGPNNRLDNQQPWSANLGFDYRFTSLPLNTGANLAYTPGYLTQQTSRQSLDQSRSRSLDVFAQWIFSRSASIRVSANNLAPLDIQTQSQLENGYGSRSERNSRTQFGAQLELKL